MITSGDVHKAKILIVDDQEINVRMLECMLQDAGYESIVSVTNPRLVCELYRKNRYDLILLDLMMPGMDGFEVMEGLREFEKEDYLPILVITAQHEHKLRALKAGAKDFVTKPFDLAEVMTRVYNMLEVRLLHLKTRKLYDQILEEQKVSERLLLNVLPKSIAERLKANPGIIADSFPEVTVLFADIVEFTKLSEGMHPERLVSLLNDVFTQFDNLSEHRGLEKIKTIGDAYMAVAGLPVPASNHAERAAHLALDMIEMLDCFSQQSCHNIQMRIGIHSGEVIAGVIGKRKFIYDLWGDTVNTASRMEAHGVAGRVQITDATRQRLGDSFLVSMIGLMEPPMIGIMEPLSCIEFGR